MTTTVAFDVYGTLIDPLDVAKKLDGYVGDKATQFARTWREKQIEYLFRRALMQDYRDFPTCTRQALEYTDRYLKTDLPGGAKDTLMEGYRALPPYPGVMEALAALESKDCRRYAFSNGRPDDLEHLLRKAGLGDRLDGIVSVHEVRSYKPDPAVYRHFLDSAGAQAQDTWLVSANPFDVIGAMGAGWNAAWLRRDERALFDPWDVEPTATITDLSDLTAVL